EARDVVGMQMGVDRLDQLEVQLLQQLAIAVRLLQHGIEDQRLAAGTAREQVGIGAGNAVEKLAEDHGGCGVLNLITQHTILFERPPQTVFVSRMRISRNRYPPLRAAHSSNPAPAIPSAAPRLRARWSPPAGSRSRDLRSSPCSAWCCCTRR